MSFKVFAQAVERRFQSLSEFELYEVSVDNLFDAYLAAFPAGTNPIYRINTEHHCSCCRQFIKNLGHVVGLKDGRVETIWEKLGDLPAPYGTVARRLDEIVRAGSIASIFRTSVRRFGAASTFEDKTGITYNHFVGAIADRHFCINPATVIGEHAANAQVMRRGLDELTINALDDVINLIDSKELYRGEENRHAVASFRALKGDYDKLPNEAKNAFVWANIHSNVARNKFRNTAIGTLVVDLSTPDADLHAAVKAFETKVAPENYQRTSTPITSRMVSDAVAALTAAGLDTAVERRYAKLSDVTVDNVLFVDNAVRSKMRGNLTDLLLEEVRHPTSVKNPLEVAAGVFFGEVLPQAKAVDLYVENRHAGNFMSITAPVHDTEGSRSLFKWDNSFAWSYDSDVADSIKQRVKRAGGAVDAKLRVSLAWFNTDDLDLHAETPAGRHIYFRAKQGVLDVDMNARSVVRDPVENLAFQRLEEGTYRVWVHQFNQREKKDVGFVIEVETNGVARQFTHTRELRQGAKVSAFDIVTSKGLVVDVRPSAELTEGASSTEKWGVKTHTLVPVDTIMLSPNYWDGRAVGARHWFFLLKGCKNPGEARGFYNEFLHPSLSQHRKVFEVLGGKMKCPKSDEQLSGLGFTSARGDTVTAVVRTSDKQARPYLIKF